MAGTPIYCVHFMRDYLPLSLGMIIAYATGQTQPFDRRPSRFGMNTNTKTGGAAARQFIVIGLALLVIGFSIGNAAFWAAGFVFLIFGAGMRRRAKRIAAQVVIESGGVCSA